MRKYIALLRGINISGKNKIAMADLKKSLLDLGYQGVLTYLNSGNVVFLSEKDKEEELEEEIKVLVKNQFNLDIPVHVILQSELVSILCNAPAWWGSNSIDRYDNLIFILRPSKVEEITLKLGEPSKELEQVKIYNNVIFWMFDRKNYAKANWWKKTASKGISELLTIRTANTLRKIVEL